VVPQLEGAGLPQPLDAAPPGAWKPDLDVAVECDEPLAVRGMERIRAAHPPGNPDRAAWQLAGVDEVADRDFPGCAQPPADPHLGTAHREQPQPDPDREHAGKHEEGSEGAGGHGAEVYRPISPR